MYTLDTNAVLYYLHGEEQIRPLIDDTLSSGVPLYISAVTIVELLRYPKLGSAEELGIQAFIPACSVINIDTSIAQQAGKLGRTYNLKLGDSIIAATALFTGTTLVTRNVRDFKKIPDLAIEAV